MNLWQSILTIVISIIGSSGLWAFIQSKQDKKDAKTRMLVGLAHDRILCLGESYINRGWITMEEYENLCDYLFDPYEKLGGNGSAKKVVDICKTLPIRKVEK